MYVYINSNVYQWVCESVCYLYAIAFSYCSTHSEGRWRHTAHAVQQRQTHTSSCSSACLTCKHRQTPESKATYSETHNHVHEHLHTTIITSSAQMTLWMFPNLYLHKKRKCTHSRSCPRNIHIVLCSTDHQKLDQAETVPLSALQGVFPCSSLLLEKQIFSFKCPHFMLQYTTYLSSRTFSLLTPECVIMWSVYTINSKQTPIMMHQLRVQANRWASLLYRYIYKT